MGEIKLLMIFYAKFIPCSQYPLWQIKSNDCVQRNCFLRKWGLIFFSADLGKGCACGDQQVLKLSPSAVADWLMTQFGARKLTRKEEPNQQQTSRGAINEFGSTQPEKNRKGKG
jgi:hypothetical protein